MFLYTCSLEKFVMHFCKVLDRPYCAKLKVDPRLLLNGWPPLALNGHTY